MGEVWREIKDFPDYEISSFGRIRNVHTGKTLRAGVHKNGKLRVTLHYLAKKHQFYVHRLVAQTFIPGWRDGIGVGVKDGDFLNCSVNNLFYHGNYVRTPRNQRIRIKIVETGQIFDTVAATARAIGGQPTNVKRVMEGTLKKHKGFTFKYVTR